MTLGTAASIGGQNGSITLSQGLVTNNNTLTKVGSDTVILVGAAAGSGQTTISAGTLQLGSGGASGSIDTGVISNSGTLAFNRNDTGLTVINVINGNSDRWD